MLAQGGKVQLVTAESKWIIRVMAYCQRKVRNESHTLSWNYTLSFFQNIGTRVLIM